MKNTIYDKDLQYSANVLPVGDTPTGNALIVSVADKSDGSGIAVEQVNSGYLCVHNSTNTPLDVDGVFTGEWEDTLNYNFIIVGVRSDRPSATDGLDIQWSYNGVDICDHDYFTTAANSGKVFTFSPARRYFRVVYTNDGVAQTVMSIQTVMKVFGSKASSHRIADNIVNDDDAELVKAVLSGENSSGTFVNFGATNGGNFKVSLEELESGVSVNSNTQLKVTQYTSTGNEGIVLADSPFIDAFDRLRVSNPHTIFDSKQLHDKQPLFWDESVGGAASSAHSSVNAATTMTVTASAEDFAIRQTFQRFNYQPGKSQLMFITFYGTQQTGVTKRIGLFDGTGTNNLTANNGIFFQWTASAKSWNIAKNGTTTETITQANWNVDPLDGTGTSGITLDMSASQIAVIDFEWLGLGRVRVGFVVDGIVYYCHYFNHSNHNTFTSVYMSTPNLPLRYDIISDGSGGGTLSHICSTVMSEGGLQETGITRSVNLGTTHVDAATAGTFYAILGIRLKSAYTDITVIPKSVSLLVLTNNNWVWELRHNPTVAGTFTYGDLTNSAVQYASGTSTSTVTGGTVIASGYIASAESALTDLESSLRLGSSIGGTVDQFVLCAAPFNNQSDIIGSLTFRELL